MEIKIGTVGRIVSGDTDGEYVKVIDDADNTGGLLILTADAPDMRNAFDNWVEDMAALVQFFEESKWSVEWLP